MMITGKYQSMLSATMTKVAFAKQVFNLGYQPENSVSGTLKPTRKQTKKSRTRQNKKLQVHLRWTIWTTIIKALSQRIKSHFLSYLRFIVCFIPSFLSPSLSIKKNTEWWQHAKQHTVNKVHFDKEYQLSQVRKPAQRAPQRDLLTQRIPIPSFVNLYFVSRAKEPKLTSVSNSLYLEISRFKETTLS